jgi:hypothetical protein
MSMDEQAVPFILLGQQLALYNALLRKHEVLAQIYYGAIKVLTDTGNPDRFALAAHDMRELMEKLPNYIDVEIKAHNKKLGDKIQPLKEQWHGTCSKTACFDGLTWSGEIDRPLASQLKKLVLFFKWHDENFPKRKEEVTTVLRKLDISGRSLPPNLEKLNVEIWGQIRNYFQGVAHHGTSANQKDFELWLDAFERFLLDRLYPRTFAEFDMIDEVILEGSNDA